MKRRTRRTRRNSLILVLAAVLATLALAPAAQAASDEGTGTRVAPAAAALPEDVHLHRHAPPAMEAVVPRDGGGVVILRRSAPPEGVPGFHPPVIQDAQSAGASGTDVNWAIVAMGAATLVLLSAATLFVMRERRTRMVLR